MPLRDRLLNLLQSTIERLLLLIAARRRFRGHAYPVEFGTHYR